MTAENADRLRDVLIAAEKCQSYAGYLGGTHDQMAYDAIVRNLEIIGEAANKIPLAMRDAHTEIPWSKVIGLRNILIHQYFSADRALVEAVIKDHLPELIRVVEDMLG